MAETPFYPIGSGGLTNWFRKLFGKIPSWNYSGRTFIIHKGVPITIDWSNLMAVYLMCPQLRAVIDRKAEMFSNADIYVVNRDGERVENHPVEILLRNPNPLQTQEQYMFQWGVFKEIYSQCFEYKFVPEFAFNKAPRVMWNLPPANMRIVPTGKIWDQTDMASIIEKYQMEGGESGGIIRDFDTDRIILTTFGIGPDYIAGRSDLVSLEKPITNIMGALATRGAIIYDRGSLGIISSESKDVQGGIPLDPVEKAKMERQWKNDYGFGDNQMQTLITGAAVKYTPMTFPTKDLMLFEEIEEDFQTICAKKGMARDIFPSTKGATFENQDMAYRHTYQNTIQAMADSYVRGREQDPHIKTLLQPGEKIVADYSWLPCMQADKGDEATAHKTAVDAIAVMVDKNMITPAQGRQLIQVTTGLVADESLAATDMLMERLSEFSPLVSNNLLQTLTINEARQRLGLPPIEGGDVLMKIAQPQQQTNA